MTLFVAVVHDRHIDPVIRVFSDLSVAIAWAEKNFKACLSHPDGLVVDDPPPEGYLWSASYEYESDHAWVEEVELDDGTDA
jgi:hypothetical protein